MEVSGEQVKLHLNIDETQNQAKAAWFRYAPPTGNLMYSMPIVGTNANLYFPSERSEDPMVIGCVRKNGGSCEKCSNVNNRYFSTESGNNLDMLPNAINFSRPGLSANFNDGSGITLSSSSSLNINAGYVGMFAGNVSITGDTKLVAEKGESSFISLENEFYNDAGIVMENGSDRAANGTFEDDPQNGAKEVQAAIEMQMNDSALVAANEGSIPALGTLSSDSSLVATNDSSIPLEGKELGNRTDVEVFDSNKAYKGEYVKSRAGDDTWILGKAYPNGTGSVFVPEDLSAAMEHRGTFLNHIKTFGWAVFNTVNETIDDIKIAKDYVCAAVSSVFNKDAEYNYFSDIDDLKEDKERINELCKDKSPYKAAYEADNSIINLAMTVDGIRSIFSVPKNIFKAGEAIAGIKVVGTSEAVIDTGFALEGAVSVASGGVGVLEAGAGIYNMSGSSNNGDVESKLLDWNAFQNANKMRCAIYGITNIVIP